MVRSVDGGVVECPMVVRDLFHRRWAAAVVASVHGAWMTGDPTGARAAGLAHGLGASREVLRQTIEFAVAHGWVRRNPGFGHPLRPEFVLTARGEGIAPACEVIVREAARAGGEVLLSKWGGPIVWVLGSRGVGRAAGNGGGSRAMRFGEIRAALPGVTDRALARALADLTSSGWARRRVAGERPPRVEYRAMARACRVGVVLDGLAASLG